MLTVFWFLRESWSLLERLTESPILSIYSQNRRKTWSHLTRGNQIKAIAIEGTLGFLACLFVFLWALSRHSSIGSSPCKYTRIEVHQLRHLRPQRANQKADMLKAKKHNIALLAELFKEASTGNPKSRKGDCISL